MPLPPVRDYTEVLREVNSAVSEYKKQINGQTPISFDDERKLYEATISKIVSLGFSRGDALKAMKPRYRKQH